MAARCLLAVAFLALALLGARGSAVRWVEPALAFELARAEARANERLVLVQALWRQRPLAERMEREVFADPRVARLLEESFVCVRLDEAPASSLAGLPRELEHAALASYVLDPRGQVVAVLNGPAGPQAWLDFARKALLLAPQLARARRRLLDAPKDSRARLELARLELELGCLEQARAHFEAVATSGADPLARAGAHERLARLCADAGDCAAARSHLQAWQRLARGQPPSSLAFTEALVLHAERRTSEALELLERLGAGSPAAALTAECERLLAHLREESRPHTH